MRLRITAQDLQELERDLREFNDGRDPWDILKDESVDDFKLFSVYRSLPRKDRTLRRMHEITGVPLRTLYRKAEKYKWKERALMYDIHLTRMRSELVDQAYFNVINIVNEMMEKVARMYLQKLEQTPIDEIPVELLDKIVASAVRIQELLKSYDLNKKSEELDDELIFEVEDMEQSFEGEEDNEVEEVDEEVELKSREIGDED